MSRALDLETVTRAMLAADAPKARRQQGKTENLRRGSKRRLAVLSAEYPESYARPRTFGECQSVGLGTDTPCPFVGCSQHLYLEVDDRFGRSASVKFNHPGKEPDELAETCALVVAARGGETYEEIGHLMNLTRERSHKIEEELLGLLSGHRITRSLAGVEDRGEEPEADDGSGARSTGEAVSGLSELCGRDW